MGFSRASANQSFRDSVDARIGADEASVTSTPILKDVIEWDVRNWSVALDFWLAHTAQNLLTRSALEIGSRNGGLSLWLALQGARVQATDIGPPTEAALKLHRIH